ncbi:DUF6010 family protein [Streptomyces prasinosporus]|uniref:DUF6010 family protein n=1 Tax=Streptomyces prasinosporus TaxID=68256 RepID=A0ABP6TW98_9ACTN
MQYAAPIGIGLLHVLLMSLAREPHRRRLNAVMVAGAGAAHLGGGGPGGWEFAFTAVVTWGAFRGRESRTFIGVAWLLHAARDDGVAHHLGGGPVVPFLPASSPGRALCDPVIALWRLRGGPSPTDLFRGRGTGRPAADPGTV